MGRTARLASVVVAAPVVVALSAGPALAHECINASKPQNAGVRVLISEVNGQEVLSFESAGLERQFLRDPGAALERFSGLIGFDIDGDGAADFSTYIVGPNDALPEQAQENGAACRGIVGIEDYFNCLV